VPATWHGAGSLGECLVRMLALPAVASKEWIIRQYDHEVQGCSVTKPLLGPGEGPADGTVIRGVLGRNRGIVLGVGLRHRLGWLDRYQMAAGAIVEAITNAVAAGADPDRIALLDNFCWATRGGRSRSARSSRPAGPATTWRLPSRPRL